MIRQWLVVAVLGFVLGVPPGVLSQEGEPGNFGGQIARAMGAVKDSSRTFRPGDALDLNVLQESSISGVFRVGASGTINHPLLGKIAVGGLSEEEVSIQIERLLESDYIRDANVMVALAERRESSVFVYGAVRSPRGVDFDAEEGITLGRAVGLVGGPSDNACTSKIELQRLIGSELKTENYSLTAGREVELQDGDVVIVNSKPERVAESIRRSTETAATVAQVTTGRVIVSGQVKREGIVEVPLAEGLEILEVIAMSGGFTRLARPAKVRVRRKMPDGNHRTFDVDVDAMRKGGEVSGFRVMVGDTIFVPESIF